MTWFFVNWVWINLGKELNLYININVVGTKDETWNLICDETCKESNFDFSNKKRKWVCIEM